MAGTVSKAGKRVTAPNVAEQHVYGPPVAIVVKVDVTALAFRAADGRYSVVIPELPGCYSAADSIEEVEANAAEAARGWIAVEHHRNRDEATAKIVDPLP
ncbi:MAG: HicB like antitoxin of bacterial toxin-antitoxin system [Planctomycetota bacterium]|nr:HicB like antitoxin of bacterial toxin-antitoxin system [Planctomycetota bacterium]